MKEIVNISRYCNESLMVYIDLLYLLPEEELIRNDRQNSDN